MPKSRRPPLQTRQPGDSTAFINANDMLESMGVRYRRPAPSHLKIGKINYFPATGKTHIDGHSKAQPKRGLEALKVLLLDHRMRLGVYVAKRRAEADRRDREQHQRDLEAPKAMNAFSLAATGPLVKVTADEARHDEMDIGFGDILSANTE